MSQRMRYFILLMLINLVVIVIYLIFEHLRRKEKYASIWMKAGMMLLCPVVGPLFLLGSFLLYKLLLRREWIFQMWYLARNGQIPFNDLMRM